MDPTRVGRYEIVRRLGRSMTDVYLAIDTIENRQAALKLVRSDGDGTSRMIMEAERRGAAIQREMQLLDPRVVEIYDVGDVDGYFFVAMQYVEGRNLAEVLRQDSALTPTRAAVIALEICEQLTKFHSWQSTVVHGDIKPSNILLGANDTVRLLDFGIAKMLRSDGSATAHQFGSPGYCSPERLTRSEVDKQSDLWAVGATLYEMLSGAPPYRAGSTRQLESLIRSGRPPRALPPSCPRALRLITMKALSPQAGERYNSAAELQADLQSFLEGRTTLAEKERRQGWSPGGTIEAARETLRKATRTVRQVSREWRLASAAAWFMAGMLLWVSGTMAWQKLQARTAPVKSPPLEAARPKIDRAAEERTMGLLALARGYEALDRLEDGAGARDHFQDAIRLLPEDPAPHLALARIYVYWLPNVESAMGEFKAAQGLGAVLGRREIEQEGDAYRLQALRELVDAPQAAWQDAAMARQYYGQIPGYDRVEQSLKQIEAIKAPVVAARRPVRRSFGRRRRTWR